ncbi:ATP-binding protein [Nonomuraea gerenzanensis]|uniref:Regulatory protein n=1 Tax=Nonomuraea gerenzanensis TaxID=93944 RepID=A0A1M4E7P0_9ACTN|nr:tetratricopeptide repeat protein [Nonomuraea gerenzanensis]UBU17154.1 tetratricopeptide repeat protein [Nonomuraea gerenzanensis]SBO94891.1 regulatory protein [Nonomuraea gerenzanensis]
MGESFGTLLRSLRHAAKLTIEELSHASGVSVRAIGDMERGASRGPQRRTVEALADALRLGDEQRAALSEASRAGRPRPVAAPVAGACELPRGVGDFTGRARELLLLDRLAVQAGAAAGGGAGADTSAGPAMVVDAGGGVALAGRGAAVVAAVCGAAGIGKTALAVQAAGRLASAFPDGRLYLDLRGMDAVPVPPAAALAVLLKALGMPDRRIPADEEERAGQYRAMLRERRCLIILDNAANEAQVRPLLPAEGPGMTIVTSRRPLAGLEGVHQIPLAHLAAAESATLLRAIVGDRRAAADPDGLAQVARLCGNLPLALRIAGNRLQSRPAWTPGQLAARLGDEGRRVESLAAGDLSVATAFALSYQQLSPQARRSFRRLALAAGPGFGVPLTAVLAELDPFTAEDALEELVDLGLLQSPHAGRYRFHDLVRLFARARLAEEEPIEAHREARRRMDDWLLEVATVAGRWFEPGYGAPPPGWSSLVELGSRQAAEDWLRLEDQAWLAALRQAARRGEHARVVEVAEAMHWFSDLWMHWGHWPEVFELSSAGAHALGEPALEAVHLNYLSWAQTYCLARFEEAEATALRALSLAEKAGDVRQQGWSLTYATWALWGSDDPAHKETALGYARRAAAYLLESGDAEGYAHAALSVASCLHRLGRVEESLEHNLHMVALLGDPAFGGDQELITQALGSALDGAGADYLALGRWQEAADHYTRALERLRTRPIGRSMALSLIGLGKALARLDRVEEARAAFQEAVELYESAGDGVRAARARKQLDEAITGTRTAR